MISATCSAWQPNDDRPGRTILFGMPQLMSDSTGVLACILPTSESHGRGGYQGGQQLMVCTPAASAPSLLSMPYLGAVRVWVWLDVSPKSQHQVTYDASHAALNELRVERVHPEVQYLAPWPRIQRQRRSDCGACARSR